MVKKLLYAMENSTMYSKTAAGFSDQRVLLDGSSCCSLNFISSKKNVMFYSILTHLLVVSFKKNAKILSRSLFTTSLFEESIKLFLDIIK